MARRRHSRRSHRMHGFGSPELGVLGSEPMSWGSLAVGAVAGFALAMLVGKKSGAMAGLGARADVPSPKMPSSWCRRYPNLCK